MKEPITADERSLGRLRPELMDHDIIRMQAQEHVWENRVIEDTRMILPLMSPTGRAQALPLMVRLAPLLIGMNPPRNGPSHRSFSAES